MVTYFTSVTYIDPMKMVKDTSEGIRKTSLLAWSQTTHEAK